jgi:hypothetical protein
MVAFGRQAPRALHRAAAHWRGNASRLTGHSLRFRTSTCAGTLAQPEEPVGFERMRDALQLYLA